MCPDCDNPYPPPFCDYADGADGGFYCGGPPPCFIDEEGNKICAVYDFSPGESRGGDPTSGADDTVGVCVIGATLPATATPSLARAREGLKGGKAKGGSRPARRRVHPGPSGLANKASAGSGKGTSPKGKGSQGQRQGLRREAQGGNGKGKKSKKSGAKKPKRSSKR